MRFFFWKGKPMVRCKDCAFYQAHKSAEGPLPYGFCFLKPPVVVMMMQEVPRPVLQQMSKRPQQESNFQLMPAAVRPQVRDGEYCSEGKPTQTH